MFIATALLLAKNVESKQLIISNTTVDIPELYYSRSDIDGELIIPDSVKTIGFGAFSFCYGITKLVLSKNLETISGAAFIYCSSLSGEIILPDTLQELSIHAFNCCPKLTGFINFPSGIKYLSPCFKQSKLLEGFTLPESNEWYTIIDDILYTKDRKKIVACFPTKKGQLNIPETVETISQDAFSGCDAITGTLTIPKSVNYIGYSAFTGCIKLTGDLILHDGITHIGNSAFSGCFGLNGILKLPESLSEISEYAFSNCKKLTGCLVIPENTSVIKKYAFSECKGFTSILIKSNNISVIEECTFEFCEGFTGDLKIPDTVTLIEKYAFYQCSGFSGTLTLSNNLEYIHKGAFGFNNFTGNLILPESLYSIGEYAFCCNKFTGDLDLSNVGSLSTHAFDNCSKFTGTITLSESFRSSPECFQGCGHFRYLKIWETRFIEFNLCGLEYDEIISLMNYTIYDHCLYNEDNTSIELCPPKTKSIKLLSSVKRFDSNFNSQYKLLEKYEVEDDNKYLATYNGILLNKNKDTIIACPILKQGTINIPDTVKTIGDKAFYLCESITGNLNLPENVIYIGDDAFSGCNGFTGNLNLPENVIYIGNGSFSGCHGFTGNLNLPENVSYIGNDVFKGCNGFTGNLILSENVSYIGDGAFSGCNGFTGDFILPENVSYIGDDAFSDCNGLTGDFILPENVRYVGDDAFRGCNGFSGESIIIPDTVYSFGEAFVGCNWIKKLVYKGKYFSRAFVGLYNLEEVVIEAPTKYTVSYDRCPYSQYCTPAGRPLGLEIDICPPAIKGNVTIYDKVKYISDDVFCRCRYLENIFISNQYYKSIEGVLYIISRPPRWIYRKELSTTDSVKELLAVPPFKKGPILIPATVTKICEYAFEDCNYITQVNVEEGSNDFTSVCGVLFNKDLTEVYYSKEIETFTIPSHITNINLFEIASLKNIYVEESNENYKSINGVLYNKEGTVLIRYPPQRENFEVEKTAETLGYKSFYRCTNLKGELVIPDHITQVQKQAFYQCGEITAVRFPDGIVTILQDSFSDCSNITDVYYYGKNSFPDSVGFSSDVKLHLSPDYPYDVFCGIEISTDNVDNQENEQTEENKGMGGGTIALIVILCITAVAVISFCIYWFVFRKTEKNSTSEDENSV